MRKALYMLPILVLFSCQSAYRIDPKSLPKMIAVEQEFKLITADNAVYLLSDIYKEHAATVIFFWQIGCPCVKRYQKRINNIYARYTKENIAFMYVSSNKNESFLDVKKEYQKRSLPLPLVRDEGGILAKAIGAQGTPTAAIINPKGEVVFLGWIDNERDEQESGRIPYFENALNELIKEQTITTNTSPMFGCSIND
jgi:peroxiredoxin